MLDTPSSLILPLCDENATAGMFSYEGAVCMNSETMDQYSHTGQDLWIGSTSNTLLCSFSILQF